MFDDSISEIQLHPLRLQAEISLGKMRALASAERGEVLFFSAKLASDGWYSCHSCHTDGHTNHLVNDNLSDGSIGAPKRVLSLLGVGKTGPWAWNGQVEHLAEQVRQSVEVTMQGRPLTSPQVADLAAYIRQFQPAPSLLEARGTVDRDLVRRGAAVFASAGCGDCHAGRQYTTTGTYDVGLRDEKGNRNFNPPSLLGVSQRDHLLHDGRAADLSDLLQRWRHGQQQPLEESQRKALVHFLRSL